jgi:DNA-binding transcriptional MocR family regulator
MPKWTAAALDLVPQLRGWEGGEGPLYARLAGAIREAIGRGGVAAGTRLPPERALADALDLSRTTVVLAYGRLREQGLLESRQGSGTWVGGDGRAVAPTSGERARAGLVDTLTRVAADEHEGAIGFMGACLTGADLAFESVWRAAEADLAELTAGTGYSPQGWPALRRAIAARFEERGLPTSPDEILVTTGGQQAIDLLGRLLIGRGDSVVLEDPTYLGAIDAFTLAGARLSPVPVSAPTAAAVQGAVAQVKPALVYLVPSFHNPTGSVMPEPVRRELARLAAAHGLPIVEDETLADTGFDEDAPAPIAAHAHGAPIFTVGSLSKLFWGGLRVGWVRGPRPLIAHLTRFKVAADLGGSLTAQAIAARVLARHRELAASRRCQSRRRYECLTRLLRDQLPDWTWSEPRGGLTLWVRLPSARAEELARAAPRYGVSIVPGPVHSPSHSCHDRVRLPYVLDEGPMAEGVARLARAWHACQKAGGERRLGVIV